MKKLFSLLLVIVMLVCFSACGKEKEEKALSDRLSLKVENVWSTYLEAENAVQSAVIWACDYVLSYCDAPCRENYVRAVAATSAAAEAVEKLTLGECILTDEDYAEFLEYGYDLSYIASDYSSFKTNAESTALACRTMALDLMTDSYWQYGIEYMKRNAEVRKDIALIQIKINANKTNEILLLSGRDNYTDELYGRAPTIINSQVSFLKQQEQVDELSDRYLDEYSAAINGFSELESIQNANYYVLEKAVQSGDFTQLHKEAVIWDEAYAVLNLPAFTMQEISATYLDENAKECTINPGDDLSCIEPIISLRFIDAPKKDFTDYIVSVPVNTEKYEVAGSVEGDSDCYISYNDGVICFDALWKSSALTVTVYDNVSVLCPYWYAYYKLTEN